jgi:hypothetical protein
MAHRHRTKTRAARRIAERTKRNAAAVDAGVEAEEDAKTRPRNARHAAQLDVLLNRHVITVDQAHAGGRFSRDFHLSGTVIGRLIGRYEPGMPRPPKKYSAPAPGHPVHDRSTGAFRAGASGARPAIADRAARLYLRPYAVGMGRQRQA